MATKTLDRLLFVQGGLCFFCRRVLDKSEASVEHLQASTNGGANHDGNCVACCKTVNALLGSMSLKEKFQVVLNQKGDFRCPAGSPADKIQAAPAPKGQPIADMLATVVDNLKQRGQSRPRTLKTLTSTVGSLFPKGAPESEVASLVQRLQATGKVTLAEDGKVSYDL